MALVYRRSGLVLKRGSAAADPLVKALQQDLRKLGYLRSGIDGGFGEGTERAVRALQFDLLHAVRRGSDGEAPVTLREFNRERVTSVTGVLDENLAACIEDILADPRVPMLPRSDDPTRANREAFASVQSLVGLRVPTVPARHPAAGERRAALPHPDGGERRRLHRGRPRPQRAG